MAESYGFFNYDQNVFESTGEYDRSYNAEEFCQYFALFIGDGVFASPMSQLKVNSAITTSTPFNVVVTAGWAFIEGHWYHNDTNKTVTIPANTSSNDVYHRICVRLNKQARTVSIVRIQQAPSEPPTNTNSYHDLVLAEIRVRANASTLYASDITDTRANKTKCGFVTGVVDQIDAEGMFDQLEAQFNEWFANIKDRLGDDPATSLQDQVNEIGRIAGETATALGKRNRNLLPYPYYQTTRTTNGITFTDIGDGTIRANGTATDVTYFTMQSRNDPNNPLILKKGEYRLSGGSSGSSAQTYQLQVGTNNPEDGSWEHIATAFEDGTVFEIEKETVVQAQIVIRAGVTVNNILFRPMIQYNCEPDSEYESYEKTIEERLKALETAEKSHVGQIVMSTTLGTEEEVIAVYGGTAWTCMTGKFLYGASASDFEGTSTIPVGRTGGSEEVTLTTAQMPQHTHSFSTGGSALVIGSNTSYTGMPDAQGFMASTNSWFSGAKKNLSGLATAGSGSAHNNMPPYEAVYIWKRTA